MNDVTTLVFTKSSSYDTCVIMYLKGMVSVGIHDGYHDKDFCLNLSMREFREICNNIEAAHLAANSL
jgi:hypothetical protein